jgi:pimeloyl-ACP methyl ester carboxylesterase
MARRITRARHTSLLWLVLLGPACASAAAPTTQPAQSPSGAESGRQPQSESSRAQRASELLDETQGKPAADEPKGYDALLSSYAYPFEVKHFPLTLQGTQLSMAYMDVSPKQPNGEVVLLLHGKNFSGAYFRSTAERLVERGYRVIMPDQIGFGKSSKPLNVQYSFHMLAQNTARLLDALGVGDVHVVGHSMGGMLAVRWALLYPERTSKLILANPIGLEDYQRVVPYLGVDAWTRQALKQTPEAIQRYMQQSYFHDQWKPEYAELLEIQAGFARGPDREHLAAVAALTQDMIFTQPVSHELPLISVPTLLVIGQLDRTAFGKGDVPEDVARSLGNYPKLGEQAARLIPRSRLIKLENVGHVPHYEAFEPWMQALEGFLSSASGPAGTPRGDTG